MKIKETNKQTTNTNKTQHKPRQQTENKTMKLKASTNKN